MGSEAWPAVEALPGPQWGPRGAAGPGHGLESVGVSLSPVMSRSPPDLARERGSQWPRPRGTHGDWGLESRRGEEQGQGSPMRHLGFTAPRLAGISSLELKTQKIGRGTFFCTSELLAAPCDSSICCPPSTPLPTCVCAYLYISIHTHIYVYTRACLTVFLYIYLFPGGAWQVKQSLSVCFGIRRLCISAPGLRAALPLTKS